MKVGAAPAGREAKPPQQEAKAGTTPAKAPPADGGARHGPVAGAAHPGEAPRETIRASKGWLEEEARAADAGRTRPPAGRAASPAPKAQSNFTDPESRIMKTSADGFQQCHGASRPWTRGTRSSSPHISARGPLRPEPPGPPA